MQAAAALSQPGASRNFSVFRLVHPAAALHSGSLSRLQLAQVCPRLPLRSTSATRIQ
jgi:hypothetical protein